jgi:hypothetical protein
MQDKEGESNMGPVAEADKALVQSRYPGAYTMPITLMGEPAVMVVTETDGFRRPLGFGSIEENAWRNASFAVYPHTSGGNPSVRS